MLHQRVIDLLKDILTHSQYILNDTSGLDYSQFLNHRVVRQAAERNMELIGTAAIRIRDYDHEFYDYFDALRPSVSVRNQLAHGYDDDVDHEILWQIVQESLPELVRKIREQL